MNLSKKDIGKKVTFKALCLWNTKKATRIIKDVDIYNLIVTVRYGGYSNFHINFHEVLEVN